MKAQTGKKHVTPRWVDRLLLALLVSLLLFFAGFGKPMILTGVGGSMLPTLRDGAREVVFSPWIFFRDVVPGRIYAFLDPDNNLCIKRATKVEAGGVYFRGDNIRVEDGRPVSIDSRDFGLIPRERIVGVHVVSLPWWFDGPTSVKCAMKPLVKIDPIEHAKVVNEERGKCLRKALAVGADLRRRGSKVTLPSPTLVAFKKQGASYVLCSIDAGSIAYHLVSDILSWQ